jgi:hypothetical protein
VILNIDEQTYYNFKEVVNDFNTLFTTVASIIIQQKYETCVLSTLTSDPPTLHINVIINECHIYFGGLCGQNIDIY